MCVCVCALYRNLVLSVLLPLCSDSLDFCTLWPTTSLMEGGDGKKKSVEMLLNHKDLPPSSVSSIPVKRIEYGGRMILSLFFFFLNPEKLILMKECGFTAAFGGAGFRENQCWCWLTIRSLSPISSSSSFFLCSKWTSISVCSSSMSFSIRFLWMSWRNKRRWSDFPEVRLCSLSNSNWHRLALFESFLTFPLPVRTITRTMRVQKKSFIKLSHIKVNSISFGNLWWGDLRHQWSKGKKKTQKRNRP